MDTNRLDIDWMLTIDRTGMPTAPDLRQLLDKDVRELYRRDTTPGKARYVQEVGVIYYVGDPKSPTKQQGLSDSECLKQAIINFDLPKDYVPDELVTKLIKRYYLQRTGIAMESIIVLREAIHNGMLVAKKLNELLREKLRTSIDADETNILVSYIDNINKKVTEFPNLVANLAKAEENLALEYESVQSRGGEQVLSSMVEE